MTTKATRDVVDLAIRSLNDFVLDGTSGTASIDGTPIGQSTPDTGSFTNLVTQDLTVTATADFTGVSITGLSAYYADLAEYYMADESLEPGTVVKLGGTNEITKTTQDCDPDVFGIISSEPAIVFNQAIADQEYASPVALVGRVPCRVVGQVTKGCRLVATTNGCARAESTGTRSLTFARSLVDSDELGEHLIEVAMVVVK